MKIHRVFNDNNIAYGKLLLKQANSRMPKTVKIGAIARGESTGGEQVDPEADPRILEIATTIIAGMYAGIYTDAGDYNCEIVANEAIDAARALIIAAGRGPQPDTKEG